MFALQTESGARSPQASIWMWQEWEVYEIMKIYPAFNIKISEVIEVDGETDYDKGEFRIG